MIELLCQTKVNNAYIGLFLSFDKNVAPLFASCIRVKAFVWRQLEFAFFVRMASVVRTFFILGGKKKMKRILAFILAMLMTVGVLTSCGESENNDLPNDDKEQNEENKEKEENGKNEKNGNSGGVQQSTNNNQTNTQIEKQPDYTRFAHSDTYNRAKQKWGTVWINGSFNRETELGFLTKAAPFKFLAEQGVVYYNSEGEPRAYGTDDNFDNEHCIQSKAWIDPNTTENDFYLLTQYISAPIDDGNFNDDTYVATYMLKYTVADDCYRDLLLSAGTLRGNLLIQQIDQEYIPEIISKSVIRYDLIKSLGLFRDLPNNGVNQPILDYNRENVANYVSNIDYSNMTITVNYNTKANEGDIYSYTYKLKESPYWDKVLVGSDFVPAITEEQRDALTPEQIMPTYSSNVGPVLYDTCAFVWTLSPSASQKATASIKYDFVYVPVDASATGKTLNDYEAGKISYASVNSLTRDYVNSLRSSNK